eukprot:gene96-biopygen3396
MHAKAAKTDGLLYFHSADHPIAPYADALLAAHLTEYADGLLLASDPEDLREAQQAIDDIRDHMTRLLIANKMRKKHNWMLEMPSSIEDIVNKDAALKGAKLLPHYPAAEANDDRLDEKLPRAPDRQDESASADARPTVSVSTLQPLVAGFTGLAASSGAPTATPPLGAGVAPPTTMTAEPCFEVASARCQASAERKRREHMGGHLIAAEQIDHLRSELRQASIANSALTEQFTAALAAKDADVADLQRRLAASGVATEAALASQCTPAERHELVESHYCLGRDLGKSRLELADLQTTYDLAMSDAKSASKTLRTVLETTERDLIRSQTELAPLRAENARLTEVVAQLTRENIDFGKRPVTAPAAPSAPALTQADVSAIIAAHLAALTRNETGKPMDTENDPRGSTSDALFQGNGNGRTVGRKHALPQSARHEDTAPLGDNAPLDPIAARKQALMRARQAKAAPSYAKAAKPDGLLHYHSADHPIAPYADAKLAAHLTEYADGLLEASDPEDIRDAQQAIDDVRDHMTRLFAASKMRKQNWMLAMPSTIEDIFNKNAALKGTKLLPHYPAAVANGDRLDEKLPRAPDRQVQVVVSPGAPGPPDDPVSVSDYFSSDDDITDPPGSSRQAPPVRPTSDRAPRATRPEPPTSPAMPSMEPPAPVRPRAKRAAQLPADTPSPTRQARADTPLTPDAPPCGPGSLPPLAPPPADRAPRHADRDNGQGFCTQSELSQALRFDQWIPSATSLSPKIPLTHVNMNTTQVHFLNNSGSSKTSCSRADYDWIEELLPAASHRAATLSRPPGGGQGKALAIELEPGVTLLLLPDSRVAPNPVQFMSALLLCVRIT